MKYLPQAEWIGTRAVCVRCKREEVLTEKTVPLKGRASRFIRWYTNAWQRENGQIYSRWWACPDCMREHGALVFEWARQSRVDCEVERA